MRWLVCVSTLILPVAALAQDSRLTLSVGGGSGLGRDGDYSRFVGARLGAEYQLTPLASPVGLRVNVGGFWSATNSYSMPLPAIDYGTDARIDVHGRILHLDAGVTGSLTPWPRGRLSPYVFVGIAGVQRWSSGSRIFRNADTTISDTHKSPLNGYPSVLGVGLRLRVAERLLQFEFRSLPHNQSTFSVGTRVRL